MKNTYVYIVKNKITNQYYYGSRKSNVKFYRTPEEDFWKYYFTSSKIIKNLIEEYGLNSFEYSIIFKSENYSNSFWYEQEIISKNFKDPLCLNKHYIRNKDMENRFCFTGHKHSKESIEKIRKNSKGMSGKKHTIESKNKIKKNHKGMNGLNHSIETIKKMSDIKLGNNYGSGNKGKERGPNSLESNKKRSLTLKGRTPWNKGLKSHNKGKSKPKYKCQHCDKIVGGLATLNRWHNNNCKLINLEGSSALITEF
jgi:NUMOD3 motif